MSKIKALVENLGTKRVKRLGALVFSLTLVTGSINLAGVGSWANNEKPEDKTDTEAAIEKEYPNLLTSPASDGELSKEETTYVVMDADGTVKDVAVTEWLRNGTGAGSIDDVSTLKDIENTANDKTFTQDGNKLTWAADGSDIKYKGKTDKELPVEVGVTYYLNGDRMSASEIAGKSGNVRIVFTYDIKDKVESGGYTMTTPYTMASGVLLDDEHFTDVKVEGGKVIDDGSKCVCLGIAFPGLQSNLNIDLSMLDIPEKVVIDAYTDKFEIDGTYTVALTGMFSDMDFSGTGSIEDKISELESALGQLGSAADKLVSGAAQLSDGADTLDANATTLKNGASDLASGAGQLSNGANDLAAGASDLKKGTKAASDGANILSSGVGQLKTGSAALSDGTGRLKDGSAALSDGTGQLKEGSADLAAGTAELKGGIDQLATGASELGNGFMQIMKGAGSLDDGLAKLSSSGDAGSGIKGAASAYQSGMEKYAAAMDAMINAETDAVTKAKLQSLRDQLPMPDSYTGAVNNYVAGVDNAYAGEQQVYEGLQQIQSKLPTLIDGITGLKTGAENLNNGANQLAAGAKDADDGAKALAAGAETADNGAKALAKGASDADDGAKQLASGAKNLDDGAAKLSSGAGSLKSGAGALSAGAGELADGTTEFKKGTSALASGASELYSGIRMFNNDGIQKLVSSLSEADIDGLMSRLKALAEASSKGTFIGDKSDTMTGESRIIFKTESVK